jgi:hypothetical protein
LLFIRHRHTELAGLVALPPRTAPAHPSAQRTSVKAA